MPAGWRVRVERGAEGLGLFRVKNLEKVSKKVSRNGTKGRLKEVRNPGAIYHVLNRGEQGEELFLEDEDRERFLAALQEACEKTAWQVHSYCLLSNHFHWVIETANAKLVAGRKWLLGTYTKRFNAIRWDRPGAGRQFAAGVEARRPGELEQEFQPLGRGGCLGSKPLRTEMLK